MKDGYFYWKTEVDGQEAELKKAHATIFIIEKYLEVSKHQLSLYKPPTKKELKSAGVT